MSVTAAKGFKAGGIAAGIKPSGALDLALVVTQDQVSVPAAAVFTTNLVAAAPVVLSRVNIADGMASAIVLNSGNANAATGEPGDEAAALTCETAAACLGIAPNDVLVCSTGLIGIPMDPTPIIAALPSLVAALDSTPQAAGLAATAILTTDTVSKEAVATFELDGLTVTVGGMAKGAAMLAPSMATMLVAITTDAAIAPMLLHSALERAVDHSFHELTVDGCRSTNDTVIVMANGASKTATIDQPGPALWGFTDALTEVCVSLALEMATDAEGATKLVWVEIIGARTRREARYAARAVAQSQLVKCSWYGEDAYWGRVLSELGASGAKFDPENVTIAYGGIPVCIEGIAADFDAEAVAAVMAEREIVLTASLGAGNASATVLTTDLTHAYIDENMGTS